MEVPAHRRWMYNRVDEERAITVEFYNGIHEFIEFAQQHVPHAQNLIRCPCKKCKCKVFRHPDEIKMHLCQFGFKSNYYCWTSHGEDFPQNPPVVNNDSYYGTSGQRETFGNYEQMVMDAAGPSIGQYLEQDLDTEEQTVIENPNPETQQFFDMLNAAQHPLWDGCQNYSKLSASLTALSLKTDYQMSEGCFNQWMQFMGDALPPGNCMPKNFYDAKKSVCELGLGCEKIDCCPNGCMLYYNEDVHLERCKFCPQERYKSIRKKERRKLIPLKKMWYFSITPRLQRLYSSIQTASEMRWHHDHQRENGSLSHPSDAKAWKHFDASHPDFAQDPRNVRLGLCSDGFAPFEKSGRPYSCWPVIITPYNLPPWMCMRREFLFLSVIIPGPSNPKRNIDVYLRPLIDELKMLWYHGVLTYDVSMKQNFYMKAALMWTINDFPAYGMLCGWQTMGKLACPICMDQCKGFSLQHSRKISWFDCHRRFLPHNHPYRRNKNTFIKGKVEKSTPPLRLSGKDVWERVKDIPSVEESPEFNQDPEYGRSHHWTKRSIFWELPYWKDQLLRHNLDVMHIERNVFVNILSTVMDTKGKTKDTINARRDLEVHCKRTSLHLIESSNGSVGKPKAQYTLSKQQRLVVCEWVKNLKLPDGYASTLSRCVDMREAKLFGMKSHDCHVFFQRLVPLAFKAIPRPIWNALTEFSVFFREICASELREDKLWEMENNVPIILCKLEQIFPPSFFDSMEHLPIHLAYEARVGGPVQYRWMYPFERFIRTLKKKVGNTNRVEGSICNAYLVEEMSSFASYYYPPNFPSRRTRVPRNDNGGESSTNPPLSIFNYPGRHIGRSTMSTLEDREMQVAHLYVLLNCPEVQPYLDMYSEEVREIHLGITIANLDKEISAHFPSWFKKYFVHNETNAIGSLPWCLSCGPNIRITKYSKYLVNGFKFVTQSNNQGMGTTNYGVCVRGSQLESLENDYYGVLVDIVELEYIGHPKKKVTLFKCDWFDPSTQGTKIDRYGNVEVNQSRRYNMYDPFILAQQAEQVYYTSYPECQQGWLGVIKTKARSIIKYSANKQPEIFHNPYQDDEVQQIPIVVANDDLNQSLLDTTGVVEELPIPFSHVHDLEEEEDEDVELISSSDEEEEEEHDDEDTEEDEHQEEGEDMEDSE